LEPPRVAPYTDFTDFLIAITVILRRSLGQRGFLAIDELNVVRDMSRDPFQQSLQRQWSVNRMSSRSFKIARRQRLQYP